jgi:transcriptional regulator with XRE-family HTH domain
MVIMTEKVKIPTPKKIRALRQRLGLTIAQAAEKVGVQPRTWYGWELPSQKRRPSPSHAILLHLMAEGTI